MCAYICISSSCGKGILVRVIKLKTIKAYLAVVFQWRCMWKPQNKMGFKLEVADRIWSVAWVLHEGWLEGLRRAVLFCESMSYSEATAGWSAFLCAMSVSWNDTTHKRFIAAMCWHFVNPLWQIMLWLFKMLNMGFFEVGMHPGT